ncbi:MAG: hypothetical protein AVDCRST_MAG22-2880 [uncultured Rubrobacteraceae bacterium]|uniref:Uncharacterized protein n=1 Tax=uncultured Rubrobacteraceae bacterium TaxID=349277 RepID=A0A6J4Q1M6_9ACTN|nr:MAG: hypothetical protein AVDCRST_MAG22-2880 [uncultured Rubrobacteraceae bacterium]
MPQKNPSTDVSGRARAFRRVAEFARREAGVAFPAARRAAGHGIEAFLKKFSEEYAKERRKR